VVNDINAETGPIAVEGRLTQLQRVLDYRWTVAPNDATNAEIARGTGITPHQTV
jgi:hypothetical protein